MAQRRSLKGALVRLSTGSRYHEGSAALARAAAKEFGRQPWIEGRGDSGVKGVREGVPAAETMRAVSGCGLGVN